MKQRTAWADAAALVAVVLVLVLAGAHLACASSRTYVTEGTRIGTRVDDPATEARLNRAAFLTKGLERRVSVQRTDTGRTAANALEVYAVLRNRTDFVQKVEWRVSWYGPGRIPNEEPSSWQALILQPNAIETVRMCSTTVDASYYYIEIREMN